MPPRRHLTCRSLTAAAVYLLAAGLASNAWVGAVVECDYDATLAYSSCDFVQSFPSCYANDRNYLVSVQLSQIWQ